jgi:5-methyltetrahydropteroyltriglutamate--homocysteine methyltransferase
MLKPLLTHEIGSLAKPNWRVKAINNAPLNDDDIEDAKTWAKFLNIYADELLDILRKKKGFTDEEKKKIINYSSLFATKLLEKSGIDVVYDGEQHRVEMYEYPISKIEGFKFYGHVRSFDNKYYKIAAVFKKPKLKEFYHLEEFKTISKFTEKPIKIPLTGPYTLVDWSFDEFYVKGVEIGTYSGLKNRKLARKQFINDMAKEIIYPNLKALYENGAKFLQIDEPAATTKREEIDLFIEGLINSVGDLKGKVFFSVHICFSDYDLLFPDIEKLEGIINEFHFEYANRDSTELGTNEKVRKGYEIIKKLKNYNFVIGLGVIDVHTDFVEPPELIRDRILYVLDIVKDPNKIFVAPDCGLRTRTWKVAYEKLRNMVLGVNMVKI